MSKEINPPVRKTNSEDIKPNSEATLAPKENPPEAAELELSEIFDLTQHLS